MNLRQIRITISLLLFTFFLLLFSGGEKLSEFLSALLPPFQLVPALISILTKPAAQFIFGLVSIFVITLVFGRIYCSFLCPLGTLQDIFAGLSRKIGWHRKHSYQRPANLTRYLILGLVVVCAASGSMLLVNLLDSFSFAGRIITQFIMPLFALAYNAGASALARLDIYLFHKEIASFTLPVLLVTFAPVMLLLIMSSIYGRLYCNTICPVGTLLGLISRASFFKLAIDRNRCAECVRCQGVCKAGCIDPQTSTIDNSRCVNCFNCLAVCPQSVVSYRPVRRKADADTWSPARRSFILGSLAAAVPALILFHSSFRRLLPNADAMQNPPVTPPGSISITHFTQSCSACHLCVSACPTKVITPSLSEYGPGGLFQPKMDYAEGFCDYECNLCGRVCPTKAILPLSPDEKKLTAIGTAELIKEKCVVYVDNNNCGACGEVCPTNAISFADKNNILYPEVEAGYCIGCGACQYACPTTPKSIVVRPNPVHKKAAEYAAKNSPDVPVKQPDRDFPF